MSSAHFKLHSQIEYFCMSFYKTKAKIQSKIWSWDYWQWLVRNRHKSNTLTHTCSIVWMISQRQRNQSSIEAMNIWWKVLWIWHRIRSSMTVVVLHLQVIELCAEFPFDLNKEFSIWVWLALCFMLYAIC